MGKELEFQLDGYEDDTQEIRCPMCQELATPIFDYDTGLYMGSDCCGAK